jgi:hypothetical protein
MSEAHAPESRRGGAWRWWMLLLTALGCFSYQPARRPAPEGALVQVRFDPPRPVEVTFPDRPSIRLPPVVSALVAAFVAVAGA